MSATDGPLLECRGLAKLFVRQRVQDAVGELASQKSVRRARRLGRCE